MPPSQPENTCPDNPPDSRAYRLPSQVPAATYPAKFEVNETVWFEDQSGKHPNVTITEREYQGGGWMYKAKDSSGEPLESGGWIPERNFSSAT